MSKNKIEKSRQALTVVSFFFFFLSQLIFQDEAVWWVTYVLNLLCACIVLNSVPCAVLISILVVYILGPCSENGELSGLAIHCFQTQFHSLDSC